MFGVFGNNSNSIKKSEFDFSSELKATDAFADNLDISKKSSGSAFLQSSQTKKADSTFGNTQMKKDDPFGKVPTSKDGSVFNPNAVKKETKPASKMVRKPSNQPVPKGSVFNQAQRNQNISRRKGNISANNKPVHKNKTMMMVNIIKTSGLYEKTKEGGYFIA